MADRKITELSAADSTDLSSSNAVLHLVNPDRTLDVDKNRKMLLTEVTLAPQAPPVGSIVDYIGSSAPAGWLLLDGSTISGGQTLYPSLWSVLPASFKSGSDIILPDARGRVMVGLNSSDSDFDAVGETGGSKDVTLTSAQSGVPAHTHDFTSNNHNHSFTGSAHNHTFTGDSRTTSSNNANVSVNNFSGSKTSGANNRGHTHSMQNHRHQPGATGSEGAIPGTPSGWLLVGNFNGGTPSTNTTGGASQTHTHSTNISHGHSITQSGHTHTVTATGTIGDTTAGGTVGNATVSGTTDNNSTANAASSHTNVQPYMVMNKIMRAA